MEKNSIPKKTGHFKTIEMSDGIVIHQNKFIHTLNPSGLEIFELCDGTLTVLNIIEEMKNKYSSDVNLECVIEDFLDQLNKNGLIKFNNE